MHQLITKKKGVACRPRSVDLTDERKPKNYKYDPKRAKSPAIHLSSGRICISTPAAPLRPVPVTPTQELKVTRNATPG
jgi:hypothetical protein